MNQRFFRSNALALGNNFIGHENTIKNINSEISGDGGPIDMALIGVNCDRYK